MMEQRNQMLQEMRLSRKERSSVVSGAGRGDLQPLLY